MPIIASTNEPIRILPLPNGLSISVFNNTRRYFGDYFRVNVEIVCRIPLLAEYFADGDEFAAACSKLGREVVYTRTEEQMGVPSAGVGKALDRLVENFIGHSFRYVSSSQFPRKVVHAKLKRATGENRRMLEF
jgi:hypothetical protein